MMIGLDQFTIIIMVLLNEIIKNYNNEEADIIDNIIVCPVAIHEHDNNNLITINSPSQQPQHQLSTTIISPSSSKTTNSIRHRLINPPKSLLLESTQQQQKSIPTIAHHYHHYHHQLSSNQRSESWIKVLYLKQGVPDNFVPNSFLKDLRKNGNVKK